MPLDHTHDRLEDALDEVIRACGGHKQFAAGMWPTKTLVDATNHLTACINPERRERFTPSQVMYILKKGREARCHVAMQFITEHTGYAEPIAVEPEDERAQLQRDFIAAADAMANMAMRIEALGVTMPPLKAVRHG